MQIMCNRDDSLMIRFGFSKEIIRSSISISPVFFMTHYFVSSYCCCILVLWYAFSIHLFSYVIISKFSHNNDFQFHLPLYRYNLVPRAHLPFCQHQDTELWNNQFPKTKILGLPASRRMRDLAYLASRDKTSMWIRSTKAFKTHWKD